MTIHDHPGKERIDTVRAFNRFYTRQIGLLDEGLLKSPFSLTEARVLYELAHRDGLVASDLVRDLGLDPGYVSRLLKKFEERGLVEREASEADARRSSIALTPAGRQAFAPLNQDSHDQVRALLDRLPPVDQERLVNAMRTVQDLLGEGPEPKVPYILRPLQVGDIGWVTRRQGMLYTEEYGWDGTYEALVAEILAEFVKKFDPKWERAWIAEREGEVVGSVFVVRKSSEVAKLRLLYVEPSARGLGIGRRLVDECIAFARAKGYKTLTLWTNDILGSARRIYQAAGFQLVDEERHHSFGKDLVGQTWDLEL
ncbi:MULTISPECIES: bifunctional helix-turn-helix transcriptional regulator/GNAT family N-acetyltransferase [unclassified Mesorhizobium]|uniref:bifunctional helix-turn-helix transcriptional regulator/GNAT family N-acetyltransferase n=1 Tax=unclassified Mesorhizobium TaxID=325217 RepID=UPI000F75E06C|nr:MULTISPECIES: bifunctional helix-turn-helix transcriptional regulator/GNAT family N-acetyltransferase [unclassified Mesorhizobium]AZO06710.1 GNAT family N-acetyltransferase [Mesorhizobium sp. M2A.F.Ca.ET.043.02.1.1]RUW39763.1 GNAT family N-acetyltransferase [Mesorhizobium sp. M2A.F.Ca.ET.015.02.1.1]RUW71014.1 GNAT family N-acetyltransferase [Mesorhizobium sp. M2A.F.Ca.ET.067.02.1.1]RVC93241.1 GNAT family N-acetyltransferase [Mesorhizobium sp. M2A.F.Ca.ET.017.03.2.1]RVC96788.1 GNAT family N-